MLIRISGVNLSMRSLSGLSSSFGALVFLGARRGIDEQRSVLDRGRLVALHLVLLAAVEPYRAALVARRVNLGLRLDGEFLAVAVDSHVDGVRVGIGIGDGECLRGKREQRAGDAKAQKTDGPHP